MLQREFINHLRLDASLASDGLSIGMRAEIQTKRPHILETAPSNGDTPTPLPTLTIEIIV